MLEDGRHFVDVLVGHLLNLVERALLVILGDLVALEHLLELVVAVAADLADRGARFFGDVVRVVVAVSEQLLSVVNQAPQDRVLFVAGGSTRLQSVTRAFRSPADDFDLVAIHDAVRPFFADATFRSVLAAASEYGVALPAISVSDTIHAVRDNAIDLTLDRTSLVAAQTPQCFRYEVLREVLEKAERDSEEATDEAGLATRYGFPARVVPGDSLNFKITRPDDLALAEAIYAKFG